MSAGQSARRHGYVYYSRPTVTPSKRAATSDWLGTAWVIVTVAILTLLVVALLTDPFLMAMTGQLLASIWREAMRFVAALLGRGPA